MNNTTSIRLLCLAIFSTILLTTSSLVASSELEAQLSDSEEFEQMISDTQSVSFDLFTNLKKVFVTSSKVGNAETLQAILLQETNGGNIDRIGNKQAPVGKRSYGIMQVQVVAARSILQRFPQVMSTYYPNRQYKSLLDEDIISLLMTNDEANIHIASHHFGLYLKMSNGNWDKAVAAYNVGIGGVKRISNPSKFEYVISVKNKLHKIVRPFNKKHMEELSAGL